MHGLEAFHLPPSRSCLRNLDGALFHRISNVPVIGSRRFHEDHEIEDRENDAFQVTSRRRIAVIRALLKARASPSLSCVGLSLNGSNS